MADRPFVSIVVPTFNNPEPLRETLASLRQLDYPAERYEIIVVDDGADSTTQSIVQTTGSGPSVRYLAQSHAGAATARNHGARVAAGEVVIFLDDDMLVPQDLIARHLETLAEYAPAIMCGYREFAPGLAARLRSTPFGRFRLKVEPLQEWGHSREEAQASGEQCVSRPVGLTANNLALRRDDFLELGGFDEEFPYAGYEDQELVLRARAAGYACLVNYGLLAWHNDRRLTPREFGERQRRGAMTSVLIASKYPDIYRDRRLLRENEPVRRDDPPAVAAKKLAKRVLSTRPGTAALFGVIALLERVAPRSWLLQRTYRVLTGVYIFVGIRQGVASYALPDPSPGRRMAARQRTTEH